MDYHVLCTHPPLSPAVQQCCDARNRAIEANLALTPDEIPDLPPNMDDLMEFQKFKIRAMQKCAAALPYTAYVTAMPEPVGRRGIKAFIACVAHGMIIGAIDRDEAKDLLYAARTAFAATGKRAPAKEKKQPSTAPATTPTEYDLYREEVRKMQLNRI